MLDFCLVCSEFVSEYLGFEGCTALLRDTITGDLLYYSKKQLEIDGMQYENYINDKKLKGIDLTTDERIKELER